MKKTILWYDGNYHLMYDKWLLTDNVIAVVSEEEIAIENDIIPIISPAQIEGLSYDNIVLVCYSKNIDALRDRLSLLNVPKDKILLVDHFLKENGMYAQMQNEIIEKQLSVIRQILSAREDQIQDKEYLVGLIKQYGLFCYEIKFDEEPVFWTSYGLQQVADEFAEFCILLENLHVESALEIGVYRGRSSYFMCAIMMRNNPKLIYRMVDIEDKLDHFERFKDILPGLTKCIPNESADFEGQSFDFVFIDADHSYGGSIRDYENVGQFARKLVAFHDIYAHEYDSEDGGTVRTWREIMERTPNLQKHIFSKYPGQCMGIGCVVVGRGCDKSIM